jgi:hypothetical protein
MPLDSTYADLTARFGFIPANHRDAVPFGAELRPVYDEQGEPVPDFQRIVRQDTAKTLEVVGKTYTLLDNKTLFAQFEQAIEESGLDATDMLVGTDYANEGRRLFRSYLFPAHSVEVKPGVSVALRLLMMNSLDKTTAFSGRAGFYTFCCANLCIVGEDVGAFKIRHTGQHAELHTKSAIDGLVAAADQHIRNAERMRLWPRIGLDDQTALDLINALPKGSKTQIDHIVHAYQKAKLGTGPQDGANLWALNAVLSAWSTYGERADGTQPGARAERGFVSANTRTQREQQVAALIECEEWRELEVAHG